MLKITIPPMEYFDEKKQEFVTKGEPTTITLEHSLVSISKWESKWHKSFLDKRTKKTNEELMDYIRCMTLTQNVNPEIYDHLPNSVIDQINKYLEDPMTATTFSTQPKGDNRIVTSEIIYYWMIQLGIPFECQKWHISRLLTLIRVCNEKASPKKMGKNDIYNQNRLLNEARRKAMKSKG